MLFQWDVGRDAPEKVQALFWSNTRPVEDEALRASANELFLGTVREIAAIDPLIRTHAEHWRPERMAVVDRNLLRLGTYEIVYHRETPPAVVINEALEIARKYSGDESIQFINGLLDQIRKDTETSAPA